MKILDHNIIKRKIQRLSYQIVEANYDVKKIYLFGINNKGYRFAQLLKERISEITNIEISIHHLYLKPAAPVTNPIEIDVDPEELIGKNLIIVDDVANTGRTLFYGFKPFMQVLAHKIEVAVLVDRKHKAFPIKVDYVGTSLATTLKEHIVVDLKTKEYSVSLR